MIMISICKIIPILGLWFRIICKRFWVKSRTTFLHSRLNFSLPIHPIIRPTNFCLTWTKKFSYQNIILTDKADLINRKFKITTSWTYFNFFQMFYFIIFKHIKLYYSLFCNMSELKKNIFNIKFLRKA